MKTLLFLVCGLVAMPVFAAAPDGAALYLAKCAGCHDNVAANDARTPKRKDLAQRTPESVYSALTVGPMREQAAGWNEEERRAVASYLTGRTFADVAGGDRKGMCEGNPPAIRGVQKGDWNGWSVDRENTRYQAHPGLAAADVPKLKLKWAFGFPGANLGYSQPTVVAGRVFVGSAEGHVYALDAASGCTWWSYDAGAWVRSAPVVAKVKDRWLVFFGDEKAGVQAVDAMTGKQVWAMPKIDPHPVARVVAALAFHDGKLYVPMSSIEEVAGPNPKYECCTFRGSVSAMDAATGKVLWKSHPITDPARPTKKNSLGTQMHGPAGGAVWMTPTIDAKRKVLYFGTGNSYTDVETTGTEAIVAMDLETGSIRWMNQLTPNDNFLVNCKPGKPNCPDKEGPDSDFGASLILRNVPGGGQVLLCGQKSGMLYALDPDQKGKLLWKVSLGNGSALGGIQWGPAADAEKVYVAVSDVVAKPRKPGLTAVRLKDGSIAWHVPAPTAACSFAAIQCSNSQSAAVTAIPGAVFSGTLDGHMRAYSTIDGAVLWEFNTGVPFETVNGVKAKGGSIDSAGPTVVNGMVFTNSGYGRFVGAPGNVLLAFSVDGK